MNIRTLYINAAAATAQVFVSAVLMLLLYRYLLHQLGPEKLGVWSLVLASGAVARLADFGLGGSVIRFVASDLGAGNRARAAQTVGMSAIAIGLVIGLVCALLLPGLETGLKHLVLDKALQSDAIGLVPWALVSLWLGAIAQVFLGTLDACQKGATRVLINLVSTAGQLLASYLIVPSYGLLGLGIVQVIQTLFTLVLAVCFVAYSFRIPIRIWLKPDKERFIESLKFGGAIQIGAVAQLFFDPTVKILLSYFGGLSSTGYYEAASRAVLQFRSIIVSAYQMLVPHLAHKIGGGEFNKSQVTNAFGLAHSLLIAISVPYFAILTAILPMFLTVWIGRVEPSFIIFGILCMIGWSLNALNTSAYMIFVATGRLRWTMTSHLVIGVLCFVLGAIFGWLYGGFGVVFGAMLALALGSAVVFFSFQLENRIPFRTAFSNEHIRLIFFCVMGDVVLLYVQAKSGFDFPPAITILMALAAFILACVVLAFRDGAVKGLFIRMSRAN
jgi:O-antigen/teichoic acid export membrane protein